MIIYGWRTRSTVRTTGRFHCAVCRSPQSYAILNFRKWFTLYFLPIFPMERGEEMAQCRCCGTTFHPSLLNQTALQEAEPQSFAGQPLSQPQPGPPGFDANPYVTNPYVAADARPAATAPAPVGMAPSPTRLGLSGLAITSLVLALLSPFALVMCFASLLTSIAAIVLGHVALSEIRRSAGMMTGRWAALSGLVIGYVMLLLTVVLLIRIQTYDGGSSAVASSSSSPRVAAAPREVSDPVRSNDPARSNGDAAEAAARAAGRANQWIEQSVPGPLEPSPMEIDETPQPSSSQSSPATAASQPVHPYLVPPGFADRPPHLEPPHPIGVPPAWVEPPMPNPRFPEPPWMRPPGADSFGHVSPDRPPGVAPEPGDLASSSRAPGRSSLGESSDPTQSGSWEISRSFREYSDRRSPFGSSAIEWPEAQNPLEVEPLKPLNLGTPISLFALSPDGRRLAVTTHNRTFSLHDIASGKTTFQSAFMASPAAMAFSHDGNYLLVAHTDGSTLAWRIGSRGNLTTSQTLFRQPGGVTQLVPSPKYPFVLLGGRQGTVAWQQFGKLTPPRTVSLLRRDVLAGYLPTQGTDAMVTDGQSLVTFSLRTGEVLQQRELGGGGSRYRTAAFSHDGRRLALLSLQELSLVETAEEPGDAENVKSIRMPPASLNSLMVAHPTAPWLMLTDRRQLRVLNLEEEVIAAAIDLPMPSQTQAAVSADGSTLAIAPKNSGTAVQLFRLPVAD